MFLFLFFQMDDDERYNRKLEAGLYTLQVLQLCHDVLHMIVFQPGKFGLHTMRLSLSLCMFQLITLILGHIWHSG
jgi:hypothetical protein